MNLPFSVEEFLDVFRRYNHAVFPAQVVLFLLAMAGIIVIAKEKPWSGKAVSAALAGLWIWMGVVYHWIFFTEINKVAWVFGALFLGQALLFVTKGVANKSLDFKFDNTTANWAGVVLMAYALLVYPLLGYVFGHTYPAAPTFGLPCPTTIFTFGMLLCLQKRPPFYLLIIPLLWSVVGTSAAINLGIKEDFGLLVAGFITSLLWIRQRAIDSKEKA